MAPAGIYNSNKKGEILNRGKQPVDVCTNYYFTKKCPEEFQAHSLDLWMNNL